MRGRDERKFCLQRLIARDRRDARQVRGRGSGDDDLFDEARARPGALAFLGAPPTSATAVRNLELTAVSARARGMGPGHRSVPDAIVLGAAACPSCGTGLRPSVDAPRTEFLGAVGRHRHGVLPSCYSGHALTLMSGETRRSQVLCPVHRGRGARLQRHVCAVVPQRIALPAGHGGGHVG